MRDTTSHRHGLGKAGFMTACRKGASGGRYLAAPSFGYAAAHIAHIDCFLLSLGYIILPPLTHGPRLHMHMVISGKH